MELNYDTANRRTCLTLPNGVVASYVYDNDSRVTSITYGTGGSCASPPSNLGNLTYTYDADGRRTVTAGSLAAVTLPANVAGGTGTAYNADNSQTAFNGTSLSYDLNGNLTGDGTNTYTWDARDHLTAISGGSTASFVYDAFGRRMSKTISGTTTQYLYDRLNPVQELNSSDGVVANLLTGLSIDEYFTRTDSSGTSAFVADALGSTVGLVNSSGAIGTSYTYQPFGATTIAGSANGNSYQFTGRENDATGLYFYRARYYSPTYQRFVSQDPIGFAGGDANLYGYVFNGPTNFRDPFGFCVGILCLPTPTPTPTPSLEDVLNNLASGLNQYPPGEPGMYCAAPPPPPPPPPKCAGPIGAEGLGLLIGSGLVVGYSAGGLIGGAIVGGVATMGGAWLAAQCGEY